jgi:predicted AAA+ superfamily ATPase
MKRQAYTDLLIWKKSNNRKPLVVYGARQVGKTWLLREFGKNEYKQTIYLNFDKNRELHRYFGDDISPQKIILSLEAHFSAHINSGDTLIIFDEVQECQRAKDSLKYFNEDAPQYHITAAGSFLGIAEGKFPVGQVAELTLFPLSFYEYLEANGKDILLAQLKSLDKSFIKGISGLATQFLREYFYIGGMPEAVDTFIHSPDDLQAVREVQQRILKEYKNDFSKHIKATDIVKVRMIWDTIPLHLARERKKFMYKDIKIGARASEFENALDWLVNTGLVYKINRTTSGKIPLIAYEEREFFKLYVVDIGLLSAMSNLAIKTFYDTGSEIFKEFKGALAEQYVLQELKTCGILPISYWGNDTGKAEVDFVLQYENTIIPLEVKASVNKKSKSLTVYRNEYHPTHSIRASLNNLGIDNGLYSIPLYLIASFAEVLLRQ